MKSQFRSILFALVVPAAACGGGRETPKTTDDTSWTSVYKPATPDASPTKPAEPKPANVEIAIPTKYDEALALGRELVGKGEFDKAKEVLDAAIALDKKQVDAHIEIARMYIAMNEKGKAVAAANKAIKLAPLSSQAWNTKGRAELTAHNYDNAIEAFTKAVELNQDNVFAWNNLGYTELLLKQYEDAAEHLLEATSRKGATGFMFNNLGTALEHLDRLDEARTAYATGGKLGSNEAVASRVRLEGVKTIVVMKDDEPTGEVHDGVRGESPKEYDLTDEGDAIEEAKQPVASEAPTPEAVEPEEGEASEDVDDAGDMPSE